MRNITGSCERLEEFSTGEGAPSSSSCECWVPLVGVVCSCPPVCGLSVVEQAHQLLLTGLPLLILATAVKEINKTHLKVDLLLLLPLLQRHLRTEERV